MFLSKDFCLLISFIPDQDEMQKSESGMNSIFTVPLRGGVTPCKLQLRYTP